MFEIQRFAQGKSTDLSWQQVAGQNIWLYTYLEDITDLEDALSYGDHYVQLVIEQASNVEGDDTNFTVTPAEGKTAADVKVVKNTTGHDLNITIGDTVYNVNIGVIISLPPFGLLSREDKKKIDASLTKAEASEMYLGKTETAASAVVADSAAKDSAGNVISDTYVTKGRAICDAVVSDSGVVFLNGLGEAVLTIPIYGKKKSPQLSLSPTGIEYHSNASGTITVTRLGTGAISYEYDDNYQTYFNINPTINDNIISYRFSRDPAAEDATLDFIVKVAETDEYESGIATVSIHFSGIGVT